MFECISVSVSDCQCVRERIVDAVPPQQSSAAHWVFFFCSLKFYSPFLYLTGILKQCLPKSERETAMETEAEVKENETAVVIPETEVITPELDQDGKEKPKDELASLASRFVPDLRGTRQKTHFVIFQINLHE